MSSHFNFAIAKPQSSSPQQTAKQQNKTRLSKKYTLNGFQLTDLVWIKPSEGKHKFEVLVRYIDPEQSRTKRVDGSYQKVIKFGQKGVQDYIDPPHLIQTRDKVHNRLKQNCDNPLHQNFYSKNILNGPLTDVFDNFKQLKKQIFSS